jgi:signal transduction histidine kinase
VSTSRFPRPTKVESAIGAVLLAESVLELFDDDPYAQPVAVRLVVALVPPVAVAFSRRAPRGVAAVVLAAWLLDTLLGPPLGTLGAGFSMLVVVFGLSAWRGRPWGWLAVMVVLDAARMSRMVDAQPEDAYIDVAFILLVTLVGRVVRRHTVRAESLGSRLQLSERARETAEEEAVQRERAVLARELHDIVAHAVSLMVVQAGTARPAAERLDDELADVLATIERSGRQALTELRRLLGVLRTDEDHSLRPTPDLSTLPELVEGVRAAGLDVRLRLGAPQDVPPGIALCAYRAVQEGLTNALRHAAGASVDVEVTADARSLAVRVVDQGGGGSADVQGSGNGLVGLRERVLLCGGTLKAGPVSGGYQLLVNLPLRADGLHRGALT